MAVQFEQVARSRILYVRLGEQVEIAWPDRPVHSVLEIVMKEALYTLTCSR